MREPPKVSKTRTATRAAPARAKTPDKAGLVRLYRQMVLIRRFELTTQNMLRNRELPGFAHLYIGQEATAVGVMAHLRPDDWITSTHRGHGHTLAKGVPPKLLLAELAGKATGCNGGRGGTMHVFMPSMGLFGTNGLVAGGIPAAVGLAISAKTRGTDQVTVAFFGDGASNHGAFHEGLNFAGIQHVPVVFVCENNLYATATPLSMATRNTNIASKAASYGFPGVQVDGNDVVAVWQAAEEAVRRARSGGGPTLIESLTYRQVGHQEGDPVIGWCRTQEEWDSWFKRDPIPNFRRFLLESKNAAEDELKSLEDDVDRTIQEAVDFAHSSAVSRSGFGHCPRLGRTAQSAFAVRCAERQAGRNGRAKLDGRGPRRHCRGNATRSPHHLFRRRNRRSRRQLRTYQEPVQGVRGPSA